MAKREVTVVINGEEFVSKAADKATKGVEGFFTKTKNWVKGSADLKAAWDMLSSAIGKVSDFVMDSFAAFDGYAASQNKLAAQSKLTGVSLSELNATAKTAREEFGLGSAVANDAATTVAKYATRAGDATRQNELLAAALNLGAASGLTAAESMEALEMGLRGQDEGFDKLLGKNPSTIWKEYADANGLAVGKMTDAQKRLAELTAVVDAGNKVGDAYNDRLKSGAGQQELLNTKLENAKIAFGAALQPVRMLVIAGLSKLIEVATPVVLALGKMANTAGLVLGTAFQSLRSTIGELAETFGRFTRNESLEQWGKDQQRAAALAKIDIEKLGKATTDAAASHTAAAAAHETATTRTNAAMTSAADRAAVEAARVQAVIDTKLGPPLARLIGITTTAIDDLGKSAREQLPIEKSKEFDEHLQRIAANAKAVGDEITRLPEPIERSDKKAGDLSGRLVDAARAGLDLAGAFGVVNDSAIRTLGSVINIGSSIAKMAGGDLIGGGTGLVAALANVATQILGGDVARKRLIAENSEQLARLRGELGNLSLNVTGSDFAAAQDALGSVINQLRGGRGAANQADVVNALRSRGLSLADLDKIANELGVRIKSDSGALSVDGLRQLFEAMGLVELGQFGQDYTSQRQAVTAGFGVNQTSEAGQIGGLAGLGARFSPILQGIFDAADLSGTRERLASVFERLNAGGLSAGELGGLTGSQLLDLLTDLIGRIDNLSEDAGAAAGDLTGTATTAGDTAGIVDVPGVGPVSTGGVTETVQAVLQSQTAALQGELVTQTGLLTQVATNTAETVNQLRVLVALAQRPMDARTLDATLETSRRNANLLAGVLPVLR